MRLRSRVLGITLFLLAVGLIALLFSIYRGDFTCGVMKFKSELQMKNTDLSSADNVSVTRAVNSVASTIKKSTSTLNTTDWPPWIDDMFLHPWITGNTAKNASLHEKKKRLPSVISIGVKKCGTTALKNFLKLHPKIKVVPGEINFFDTPNYDQGLEFYRSLMPDAEGDDVVYEKTPSYFYSPLAPSRIRAMNHDVKLILVVCDPANRTFSDFEHTRMSGYPFWKREVLKFKSFEEYVESAIAEVSRVEKNPRSSFGYGTFDSFVQNAWNLKTSALTLLTNGIYAPHLRHWFTYFGADQILIVDGDKLLSDPASVMLDVQRFLKLDVVLTSDDFHYNNASGYYCTGNNKCVGFSGTTRGKTGSSLSPKLYQKLKQFFHPFNKDFSSLINKTFNWI